ncbi:hypothetical protein [Mycolicibacterium agri]|uniref:hypothetical protein n=1 Tax=Mycolicibacterium agri TaxID=36811 RepID=UPI001055E771|nr:hypothetical protein [Mycolicibacterium agri]
MAVPAVADPGDAGSASTSGETSKGDGAERPSLGHVIQRMIREHRDRVRNRLNKSPSVKVGSKPDSPFVTTESTQATSGAPEGGDNAAASTRTAEPAASTGGSSNNTEHNTSNNTQQNTANNTQQNTANNTQPNTYQGPDPGEQSGVAPTGSAAGSGGSTHATTTAAAPPPAKKSDSDVLDPLVPYPYYLIEMRSSGKVGWWSADPVAATFEEELIEAILPEPRIETPEPKIDPISEPEPEPAPKPAPSPVLRGGAPAPAFRGGVPEPPLTGGPAVPEPPLTGGPTEPEPVLDALGGVVTGVSGGDHRGTGFGAGAVLQAPIIAAPGPNAGAVRFPSVPQASAPRASVPQASAAQPQAAGAGSGLNAPRGTAASEPVATGSAPRAAGGQEPALAGTVTPMAGRTPPRQGYTDYLRAPGLPQLAGAALPGVAWIVMMTFTGAVIGYRQAEAGRMVRSSKAARYLP